jgi:hypothetical protein
VYDAPLEWSVDPWRNIANGVRLNAIIDFLAQYISRAGDPAKAPDERSAMKLRRQLIELVSDRAPHASAFNDGHAKAVRESMFPAERQANVFIRLAEQISTNGTDEAVFRVQARRFLALATKLGIEHPDIDLLAAMYNQPKQSLGIVGGHQEVYSLGWLSGRGRNEPLGLQARDARVVFVYLNTDRADLFLDLARSIVADDVELTKVGFISTTQHEVLTMVHRELMHKSDGGGEFVNSRVQVVFEGSEAFERRVGELANGSFWPSDD